MNRRKNFRIAGMNKEQILPTKQQTKAIRERLREAGFETAHNCRGAVLSRIGGEVGDNVAVAIFPCADLQHFRQPVRFAVIQIPAGDIVLLVSEEDFPERPVLCFPAGVFDESVE